VHSPFFEAPVIHPFFFFQRDGGVGEDRIVRLVYPFIPSLGLSPFPRDLQDNRDLSPDTRDVRSTRECLPPLSLGPTGLFPQTEISIQLQPK